MSKERRIGNTAAGLMVGTALMVDLLQWLLGFIYMDWVAGIFAGLTFYVWFKTYGMSFTSPKRLFAFGGASVVEMIPIPFVSELPAWTGAVVYLILNNRVKTAINQVGDGQTEPEQIEELEAGTKKAA